MPKDPSFEASAFDEQGSLASQVPLEPTFDWVSIKRSPNPAEYGI